MTTAPTSIFVGLRCHTSEVSSGPIDYAPLRAACQRAAAFGAAVVGIAVGGRADVAAAAAAAAAGTAGSAGVRVEVFRVAPWGRFVPALNALVGCAARAGCDGVLFLSTETLADAACVDALGRSLRATDAVAGAALPGHAFAPGAHAVTGTTCPWNTAALWRTRALTVVGFLPLADGLHAEGAAGGVEEASALAALQRLAPPGVPTGARLVGNLPGIQWQTQWDDPKRLAWHTQKMESKVRRAGEHLDVLGGAPGSVDHWEWDAAATGPVSTVQCKCGETAVDFAEPSPRFRLWCCCCDCFQKLDYAECCGGPKLPAAVRSRSRPLDLVYFGNRFAVRKGRSNFRFHRLREGSASTNCVASCCETMMFVDHTYYKGKCLLVFPEVCTLTTEDMPEPAFVNDPHDWQPEEAAALGQTVPHPPTEAHRAAWRAANHADPPARPGTETFAELLAGRRPKYGGPRVSCLNLEEGAEC